MTQIRTALINSGDYWILPHTGRRVTKHSLSKAIEQFNEKCPVNGGWLDRAHPHMVRHVTHTTRSLRVEGDYIIANVDPVTDYDLSQCELKPIVVAPCDDEEMVIEIVGAQIERTR